MFLFTSLCGYSELLETLHKMSGTPKLSLEPSNVPAGNPGPAQRFLYFSLRERERLTKRGKRVPKRRGRKFGSTCLFSFEPSVSLTKKNIFLSFYLKFIF